MIQQVNMVINKKELTTVFSKLHVKCLIGRKKSTNELVLIELLREEIGILILNSVMERLLFLFQYISIKFDIEENIDSLFRFVLLSSKNKILTKLKLFKLQNCRYRKNVMQECLLSVFEPDDYETFLMLVNSVKCNDKQVYSNEIFLRILLEHLVVKISSALVYDIFLSRKISTKALEIYSIDSLLLLSYSNKMYPYLKCNSYLKSVSYKNKFVQFLTLTKSGITLKNSFVETLGGNKTIPLISIPIYKFLKLFHLLSSFLIHKLAKS
jgi:hypothetical protein